MSDETPPPPLRLRPRQRPESETPPEPAAAGAEEGKLRLKPKLSVEPEPAEQVEPEPAAEPIRLKPKLTLEPDPEPVAEEPLPEPAEEAPPPPPMPEEGKIKLKIKLPGAAAQEAAAPAGEMEETPALPPFPVVAPPPPEADEIDTPPLLAATSATRPPVPMVGVPPSGGSRPAVFKRPRVPAALMAAERRKRLWKYALIAVMGVVLAALVIGGAYLKFTPVAPTPVPPRQTYIAPIEPVVKVQVPDKVPTKAVPLPEEPVSGERVASTATVELAPGVTATTEMIQAVPNASAGFKAFVAGVKISGVYQGKPPRAFINGRLFRTGEMVDDLQEIYFDSIDGATRSLVFKDARGATVSRRY